MPTPNTGETEREYVARCVPMLIAEGKTPAQAVATCHAMYDEHKKPAVAASAGFVLNLAGATDATPVPMGLEGLPTANAEGEPIHYRRMKIATCGQWTHRGTGEQFKIDRARADEWVRNSTALAAAGVKPFVPGEHRASFNAKDNHGYVERVEHDGKDVYAVVGFHGDEALKLAARNGRSIYVVNDAKDAKGNVFKGESLHHLALVPNPALPDLGGMARIAASADRPAIDVPAFTLSAAATSLENEMNKELAKKFREKMGVAADVPDADLADLAATKALALSADVATLTTDRDKLKGERDAEAQKVLSLSASDKELDAHTMIHVSRSMSQARDELVKSAVMSEGGVKQLDAVFMENGKPNKIALSLSANPKNGQQDWLYTRVMDIIASNPGIKVDNAIPRDVAARSAAEDAIRLSLSADDAGRSDTSKIDRQAELLRQQLGIKKSA